MVLALKRCEEHLEAQRLVHQEELQKAQTYIVKLEKKVEGLSARASSFQKEQQKVVEQRDQTIQR